MEKWRDLTLSPEMDKASARLADYYHQRGVSGADLSHAAATALGGFVKLEAVAHGIQSGLRFLSLFVGGFGLIVASLLFLPAKPR